VPTPAEEILADSGLARVDEHYQAWHVPLNRNVDRLNANRLATGLEVQLAYPDQPENVPGSLFVHVAAGTMINALGQHAAVAEVPAFPVPATATTRVWVGDDGSVAAGANWPPDADHARLATVTTDAAKVTGIADERPSARVAGFGWERRPIRLVTAAAAVLDSDGTVLADTTAGVFALTLPSPVGRSGRILRVKQVASANALTVGTAAGQIDGAATKVYAAQNEAHAFQSDGANWWIVG
jgi:hypothetical protein